MDFLLLRPKAYWLIHNIKGWSDYWVDLYTCPEVLIFGFGVFGCQTGYTDTHIHTQLLLLRKEVYKSEKENKFLQVLYYKWQTNSQQEYFAQAK